MTDQAKLLKERARRRKWAKDNNDYGRAAQRKLQAKLRDKATVRSTKTAERAAWSFRSPKALWHIRTKVPFSYLGSKNRLRRYSGSSFRKEATEYKLEIIRHVKRALDDQVVIEAKVWIDILVQKPNHRGDAVNLVDLVCDAVKVASGVDDRWFSIRQLDWEVVKKDPCLIIGISQEVDVVHRICTYCGGNKPFSEFRKRKKVRGGFDNICTQCRAVNDE